MLEGKQTSSLPKNAFIQHRRAAASNSKLLTNVLTWDIEAYRQWILGRYQERHHHKHKYYIIFVPICWQREPSFRRIKESKVLLAPIRLLCNVSDGCRWMDRRSLDRTEWGFSKNFEGWFWVTRSTLDIKVTDIIHNTQSKQSSQTLTLTQLNQNETWSHFMWQTTELY